MGLEKMEMLVRKILANLVYQLILFYSPDCSILFFLYIVLSYTLFRCTSIALHDQPTCNITRCTLSCTCVRAFCTVTVS